MVVPIKSPAKGTGKGCGSSGPQPADIAGVAARNNIAANSLILAVGIGHYDNNFCVTCVYWQAVPPDLDAVGPLGPGGNKSFRLDLLLCRSFLPFYGYAWPPRPPSIRPCRASSPPRRPSCCRRFLMPRGSIPDRSRTARP